MGGIVALDQIVNNAAKIRYMSGGVILSAAGDSGPGSAAHQLSAASHRAEAWFCHVPA